MQRLNEGTNPFKDRGPDRLDRPQGIGNESFRSDYQYSASAITKYCRNSYQKPITPLRSSATARSPLSPQARHESSSSSPRSGRESLTVQTSLTPSMSPKPSVSEASKTLSPSANAGTLSILEILNENALLTQEIVSKSQQREHLHAQCQQAARNEELGQLFAEANPTYLKSMCLARSKVDRALKGVDESLGQLKGRNADLNLQLASLLDKKTQLGAEQEDQIARQKSQISQLEAEVQGLKADIQSKHDAFSSLTTELKESREKNPISQLDGEIRELKADMQSSQKAFSSLTAEVKVCGEESQSICGRLKNVDKDVNGLREDRDRFEEFRAGFSNRTLNVMWQRATEAHANLESMKKRDLPELRTNLNKLHSDFEWPLQDNKLQIAEAKKDINNLRCSTSQLIDSVESTAKSTAEKHDKRITDSFQRLTKVESRDAEFAAQGGKLQDLEKRVDRVINRTYGETDSSASNVAEVAPSLLVEVRGLKEKLASMDETVNRFAATSEGSTVKDEKMKEKLTSIEETVSRFNDKSKEGIAEAEKLKEKVASLEGAVNRFGKISERGKIKIDKMKEKLSSMGDTVNRFRNITEDTVQVEKFASSGRHPHRVPTTEDGQRSSLEAGTPEPQNSVTVRDLDNSVVGLIQIFDERLKETVQNFYAKEDAQIELPALETKTRSFVVDQLHGFEQKIKKKTETLAQFLVKKETTQLKKALLKLESRARLEDTSSLLTRVMQTEQEIHKLKPDPRSHPESLLQRITQAETDIARLSSNSPQPSTEALSDRISRVEQGLKSNMQQPESLVEIDGPQSCDNIFLAASPVSDQQIQPVSSEATALGLVGEKFATIKFVQGHLRFVHTRMDELAKAHETGHTNISNTFNARFNFYSERLETVLRSLDSIRVPLQALETRYNNLVTDSLVKPIVNEIARIYPDARNFQHALNHYSFTINQLQQKYDQLAITVEQLRQARAVNGDGNNAEAVRRQGEPFQADLRDLSDRVEQYYQNWIKAQKEVLGRVQNIEDLRNRGNVGVPEVRKKIEELTNSYKLLDTFHKQLDEKLKEESVTRVNQGVAIVRLKGARDDCLERVAKVEPLVAEVQKQMQTLHGERAVEQKTMAKITSAIEMLNDKNGLQSDFWEESP